MRVLLIADDLTGAADSAAAFARPSAPVSLMAAGTGDATLDSTLAVANRSGSVLAIDTDTRDASPQQATGRLAHLLARPAIRDHHGWTLLKIDSLLRGPIAAQVGALRAAGLAERIVCAPALPALGRTTVDGRQLLDGRPIDERHGTDPRRPTHGASVAAAIGLAPDDTPGLSIHDADHDHDLDHLLATLPAPPHARPLLLVGSAGLAAALDRRLDRDAASPPSPEEPRPSRRAQPCSPSALVVSLSPTTTARAQVERLRNERPGILHVTVSPAMGPAELASSAARLADALAAGARLGLLTVDAATDTGPSIARTRAALLAGARTVLTGAGPWPAFIGNGGDATRCILDSLDRTVLEVHAALEDGAVWCRTELGDRRIDLITKSGSFGDPDALRRAVGSLAAVPTPT